KITAHYRANRRAGGKEKFNYIHLPQIIFICNGISILVDKLKFGNFLFSFILFNVNQSFRCLAFYVQPVRFHNLSIFNPVNDPGDKNNSEDENDKTYAYV